MIRLLLGAIALTVIAIAPGPALSQAPPPPPDLELEEDWGEEEDWEDDWEDEDQGDEEGGDRPGAGFGAPTNPLQSPGEELDRLLERRFNEDVWQALLGELPCADTSEECLATLQQEAIQNSPILLEIDERIEEVQMRIDEARANNRRSVVLEAFTPVLQYYLTTDRPQSSEELARARSDYEFDRRAFERQQDLREALSPDTDPTIRRLQRDEFRPYREPISPLARLAGDLLNPGALLNNVLNLIGIPLIQGIFFGGSNAAQARSIQIGDLQIRLAQMQRDRAEVAGRIRDRVVQQAIALDTEARQFQISQEIGLRDARRLQILRISYRYAAPGTSTEAYLGQLSSLDRQKAEVLRSWTRLRTLILDLKILVTGNLELL